MGTSLTVSMSLNAIAPIQPLFIIENGATNVELGLILAVSSLTALVSRIPLSIVADRVGRRRMITMASLIQFISLVSFVFVTDVMWFYPLMVLQSMIWGLFGPSVISLVSDLASLDKMGRVMGMYYTSIGLGQLLGPLLSSILTQYLNLRHMFLSVSILPIVGLLCTMQLKSTVKLEKRGAGQTGQLNNRGVVNSLKTIFRSKNIIGLSLSRVTFSFSAATIATLLTVWTKTELHFTTSMISLLFAARGATNTFIRMPIGSIIDRIGKKKPILFAFSLATMTFLTFSVSTDFMFLLLAMAIYGLAWGMRIVPDTAILTSSVRSEDRGLALAILMSMFALGNSAGSYVAGVTYTVLPMNLIFLLSAIILVLGTIILTVFIKEK